jgi:hypothetical protein
MMPGECRVFCRAVGVLVSSQDDISGINTFANELEIIANRLSTLMPAMRAARQDLSDTTPGAAWKSHFISADAFAAATPEALGFARIERARQRLLQILREPWDDGYSSGSPAR